MKFSEQWLREWVNPAIDSKQLSEKLTMAGLEVESVESVAEPLNDIVIGQVTAIDTHPDADKLKVCSVNIGAGEALCIVCGANNVEENGLYPVAKIGAVLPGGLKIKKAKLRGVESFGMLCSEKELGLSDSADGLMTLPNNAPIGSGISDYLVTDDLVFELGLTPNRGDCLSVAGVAREVGVLCQLDVQPPIITEAVPACDDNVAVRIEAEHECPHYVGRVIKNINRDAQTPIWMRERLRRCGVRSISPVVDVTNFVMLELGQPMHAFDLHKLNGEIVVRLSTEGEKITLLDGQSIALTPGSLLIADQSAPLALAGIMGGADTAVEDDTQHLFLESAYFDPQRIAGRARSYGLHTDSSHRFERGVDPSLQRLAMDRATQLLLAIVGGEPGPITEVTISEQLPERVEIPLRHARIEKLLGCQIVQSDVDEILHRSRMLYKKTADEWHVVPPSFRFDIQREVDLIEEVARIRGYNNIPSLPPVASGYMNAYSEAQLGVEEFQRLLVDLGYQEAVTYSFVDEQLQKWVCPEQQLIQLSNPIASDMGSMRASLWPGLLQALRYNLNRQHERVRLFETGLRFILENNEIKQEPMLAGVICGRVEEENWRGTNRETDFFDVKADIEAILALTANLGLFSFANAKISTLHPGQSATITKSNINNNIAGEKQLEYVGCFGAIHPSLQLQLDLPQRVFLFELRLDSLRDKRVAKFESLSKFPTIRRDLAIVVDDNVTADALANCIKNSAPSMLRNLKLFDVYSGKGIDSGRKSLAFGLTLQNQERTLTDDEVDAVMNKILSNIEKELGGTLRN